MAKQFDATAPETPLPAAPELVPPGTPDAATTPTSVDSDEAPRKRRLLREIPEHRRWERKQKPKAPVRVPRKREVEQAKRALAKKMFDAPGLKPLEVIVGAMIWYDERARKAERLMGDIETTAAIDEIIKWKTLAVNTAAIAAPFLHSKMAPIVPKGETGVKVALIIEDA